MLKAEAKPSIFYEAVRDKDGTPTVTRKNISNLSTRIHSLEETASIEALIIDCKVLDAAITAYNKLVSLSLNKNKVLKYFEKLRFQLSFRIPVDDINEVYDLKSNGNCKFRSLAIAIKGNKENWILVKLAMSSQLTKHMKIYKN
ncbi:19520_t:CDS:2 [Cetraspora pellucida]|uniref:19520_t:CDS:1 n=1 Tax=Cetraspora pellucida TaxID=1433469 RepID=A0A9N9ISD1_9GLOM|nr:19520_t:CDS:2 [Cetraspora pellucida]